PRRLVAVHLEHRRQGPEAGADACGRLARRQGQARRAARAGQRGRRVGRRDREVRRVAPQSAAPEALIVPPRDEAQFILRSRAAHPVGLSSPRPEGRAGGLCPPGGQAGAADAPHDREDGMRMLMGRLGVVAVAGLVLLAARAGADGEKVPLDKIPKPVMDAVKARFPGCEITSAEKETMDGKVIYDIELKHNGKKYEMDIQEDGTVLEIEKEVALKDVPEAVKKAVEAKYPRSTIKEVMEVNKVKGKVETPDHYEVVIETAEKKKLEL